MNLLAIDVGTSSVKAGVLNQETGAFVGTTSRVAYSLHQPTPETAELSPTVLWQSITESVRSLPEKDTVEGIGFSCLTPCLILLDQEQRPLTNFVTHLDRRGRSHARQIQAEHGQAFLAESGNKPLPGGISGIAFQALIDHDSALQARICYYLHCNSWLALRCTGKTAFDPGNACFTGLFDWRLQAWSPKWCEKLRVKKAWLPAILPGDTTLGELLPDVADEWNLRAGLPVKLGLPDTSSAILAVDLQPDELLHVVGTTQVLAQVTDQPQPSSERLMRHLGLGRSFIHVAHNPVGGVALDWIHRLCFLDQSDETFYSDTLPNAIDHLSTSVKLEPPYLGGDRLQIEESFASLQKLSLATDRMDVLKAILLAMLQGHEDAMQKLKSRTKLKKIYLSGGGSRWIKRLIPEYDRINLVEVDDASLRGICHLFTSSDGTQGRTA